MTLGHSALMTREYFSGGCDTAISAWHHT